MPENRSARFIESSSAGISYDDSQATGPDLFSQASRPSQSLGLGRDWLIGEVAGTVGMSKKQAGKAVGAVFDAIAEALKRGDEVRLVGFGTFSVGKKLTVSNKKGRQPYRRKKVLSVPSKPTFKASKGLTDSAR